VQGNGTEQKRNEAGNDDSAHVFHDGHGGEGIDVEGSLCNIKREELLENTKRRFNNLETMEKASKELLYDESKGCDKECTVLQMVLDLLTLKARNGNSLPTSTYLAKKLLSPLTLGIQQIHACLNHCILYRKEHNNEVRCPMCNASRYKTNYDNADDGSMDNRKKRDGRRRKLLTKGKKRSMKEKFRHS
jgi:hypothetical protein